MGTSGRTSAVEYSVNYPNLDTNASYGTYCHHVVPENSPSVKLLANEICAVECEKKLTCIQEMS